VKLHSPEFERKLRRGVRQAVRAEPALKRAARQGRRPRHSSIGSLLRPGLSCLLAMVVWNVASGAHHRDAPLAIISLWAIAGIFFQAARLQTCLYQATDLPALELMPVAPETIFRWQFQKFFRHSLWWLFDLTTAFAALAFVRGAANAAWLAVLPIAGLAWWVTLSLAVLLVARGPAFPYALATLALWVLGFVLLVTRELFGSFLLAMLDLSAPWIVSVLPTGWPASGFKFFIGEASWEHLGWFAPALLLSFVFRPSLAVLRRDYVFTELPQPESPDVIPGESPEMPTDSENAAAGSRRVGMTEIEEIIRTRQFLSGPAWAQRGWFEARLWRWLGPRERQLSELVWPDGPSITGRWKKVFRNLAVGMAVAFAVGLASPGLRGWLVGLTIFVTGCQALAAVLATGAPFHPLCNSGVNIPLHAGFPVSYGELVRLLFKYSVVQLPPLLGFTLLCGSLSAVQLGSPWMVGCVFGVKLGVLLLGMRLALVVFAFSSGTNDSSRCRPSALALIAIVLTLAFGALASGIAGLFVPVAAAAWLLVLLSVFLCFGLAVIYGWFYNAHCFDLMNLPRSE
jgi:hypothetical protein